MPNPGLVEIYESNSHASRAGAESFAACAGEAVARRGRFDVALSGGETPLTMYRLLAEPPLRDQIPWALVHLFWGDDRGVPPEDPRSNYGMAREAFVSAVPIPEGNVHRMLGEIDADEAAARYAGEIREHFGAQTPVFDLIHLGVGEDGHTASLFPGGPELDVRAEPVVASVDPDREEPRITLTFPVLDAARRLEVLVLEGTKARLVAGILRGAPWAEALPAARIAPQGLLVWMLGPEAAREISSGAAVARRAGGAR
jgi:6-phosphogluconolactonase